MATPAAFAAWIGERSEQAVLSYESVGKLVAEFEPAGDACREAKGGRDFRLDETGARRSFERSEAGQRSKPSRSKFPHGVERTNPQ